jgi:hypothetical protein
MGFSFEFSGTRGDMVRDLDNLDDEADLYGDEMGDDIRGLLSTYLREGGDPAPGTVYRVKAEGHSGRVGEGHTIRLNIQVGTEPLNADKHLGEDTVPAGKHRITAEGKAGESLLVTAEFPPA